MISPILEASAAQPATTGALHGAVRLHDWGVIRAQGEEARKFLHGQLTQDVLSLAPGQARLAGFCSAKGRLLASFVMWSRGADEVLLACSADLLPVVLKRLQMFVLRARCKLSDASAELPLWGLAGESAGALVLSHAWAREWQVASVDGSELMGLPAAPVDGASVPRWLCVGSPSFVLWPALPALEPQAWAALEALSGVARIVAATAEQFVPQMVNLELVGGVNFQKGCYPGQEVVARSQYRGTTKRRAQVLHAAAANVMPLPGQEIFHAADPTQPAGMVVLAGALPGRAPVLLAELKLAALDGAALHLGAPDGPALKLGALPYGMPMDAA